MSIYLDHAATTPLHPDVLAAMLPHLTGEFGNPSSLHRPGQRARRAVEEAREQVARAIGAKPKEIAFTSGATEADNHALRAGMRAGHGQLLSSALEHAAVLGAARALAGEGHAVRLLEPDEAGTIPTPCLQDALKTKTALAAFMLVNNETGVRSDVAAFAEAAHSAGALFFCDAVQAFGCEALDVRALHVDLLSLSAHKAYGPKGVGALYVRDGLDLAPFLVGGSQERGLRGGTHNVAGIVGMGAAAELALARLGEMEAVRELRDALEEKLTALPGVRVNGQGAPRGPKHLNVQVAGVDGESLLMALDAAGVYVSAGSACAAGSLEPSHVLLAMGLPCEAAKASVRFSLGHGVTAVDIETAAARFRRVVESLRAIAA